MTNLAKIDSGISRRLGLAFSDFRKFAALWNHTNLPVIRKFMIYRACICSTLLYGLESAWLNKRLRNRIDGFHARCLRKMLRILPSYWSRIANVDVLKKLDAIPLSSMLLEKQLLYFGKLFRLPDDDCRRKLLFKDGASEIQIPNDRRRGRPRAIWGIEVGMHASIIGGPKLTLEQTLHDEQLWKQYVRSYIRN